MKAKSTFTFLAGLAMAAFATLAPNVCEAVTIKSVSGKITASGNKSGYVLLKWNAIKGATKSGKKGMLGYFTSKKKGTGYYTLKIGAFSTKKRKIIWK